MPESPHISLKEALARFQELNPKDGFRIGTILQAIDEKGFGLILILLSLPSAIPAPAAGYSTPFGIAILIIGIQMLQGKHAPVLPQKVQKITLPQGFFRKMIAAATKFLSFMERFIRPRFQWFCQPMGRRMLSILVMMMAALMCLPIPGTNTIPAFVIFLIGVCLSEEDGLVALAALAAGLFAILVYCAAIYFLVSFFQEYGWDAIDVFLGKIKDFVKGLLGMETAVEVADPSSPPEPSAP